MKYARFEDVPVWQAGLELATGVFDVTGVTCWRGKGDLANQLQRAALSVSNNIAEGFERGTTAELLTFLYYAKGSAGEVRSICHVVLRVRGMEDLKSEISDIKSLAESISRQLAGWAKALRETDIAGPKRLTESGRAAYQQRKGADAFLDKLKLENEARLQQRIEERRSET